MSRCCGETHVSSAALQEVWSCGVRRCGLSMQQRLRAISMGSVSYLLLWRTLSMGDAFAPYEFWRNCPLQKIHWNAGTKKGPEKPAPRFQD